MANKVEERKPFTDLPEDLYTRDIAIPLRQYDYSHRVQMKTEEPGEESVRVEESRPVRLTLWQALAAWVRGDNSNVTK